MSGGFSADVVIPRAELVQGGALTPAVFRNASWFADVWATHCRPGMHLRSIHYKLMSLGSVLMPAGVRPHEGRGHPAADPVQDAIRLPYENTEFCWLYVQKAALAARYWRLVDARDFEEHRSPEPIIHDAGARATPTPSIEIAAAWPESGIPTPIVFGYDYREADQPLTIELWCEKSTMDHILEPLTHTLGVNYQPLTGMYSVTRGVEMLCRLQKPAIVLYVSDLDAAGCNMPTAFADALAHYGPIYAPGVDIRLKQLALTEDQVLAYALPRNVIDHAKASPYNRRFREEHPLGPCELDALEAIHSGELARLVRAAVAPYRDRTLSRRLAQAEAEAERRVHAAWDAETAEARQALMTIDDAIDEVEARLDTALRPHYEAITAVRATFDDELAPLEEERDEVRDQILNTAIEMDLPERPVPAVNVPEDGWLYIASRAESSEGQA